MRSRYEPEGWTGDLDVDFSTVAVLLEQVMVFSLETCAELIRVAINYVSRAA